MKDISLPFFFALRNAADPHTNEEVKRARDLVRTMSSYCATSKADPFFSILASVLNMIAKFECHKFLNLYFHMNSKLHAQSDIGMTNLYSNFF